MLRTIAKDFRLLSSFSIILVALLIGGLWALVDYLNLQQERHATRTKLRTDVEMKLQERVEHAVHFIDFQREQAEPQLKQKIRSRTYEACAIATELVNRHQKDFSPEVLADVVRDSLRDIRYSDGRGYFFAFNMNGTKELAATNPQLEGENWAEIQSDSGQFIVKDMLAIARESGEGYYRYQWSKPGSDKKDHTKIAFVKYLPELDWIVGTGEYVDDAARDQQAEVIESINAIHRDHSGRSYLFVVTWDGFVLTGPGKGKIMLEIQDANGLYVVKELIRKAKQGGGFVQYVVPKLKGLRPDPKLSYVAGIPEWRWYVGTGEYIDSIDATVSALNASYRRNLQTHFSYIFVLTLAVLLVNLVVVTLITGNLQKQTRRFVDFFQQAAANPVTIDEALLTHDEFRAIGSAANIMLEERNKALRLAHVASEHWIKTFNAISDAILLFDHTCTCIQINQAAEQLFAEAGKEEIVGKHYTDFLSRQNLVGESCHRLQRYSENISTLIPGKVFSCSSYPLLREGQLDSVIYILTDVTAQQEALQKLKQSEDQYRVLFNEAVHGSAVIDAESGVIIACNYALSKLIGRPVESIVGQPQSILFPDPPDREDLDARDAQQFKLVEGQVVDSQLVNKDGETIDVEINAHRMNLGGRDVLHEFFYDVSKRAKIMAEYRRAAQLAALGTIAAGVAHEINNPIQGIMNYAAMIQNKPDQVDRNIDISRRITAESERIAEITKELLDFSRDTHKEKVVSDLTQIVNAAIHLIEKKISKQGIVIETHYMDGLPGIPLYPQRIQQVVINLIDNAADAINSKQLPGVERVISVSCRRVVVEHGGSLCLEVADRGIGMSEEVLSKACETFFSTKPSSQGTGLGLSIVSDIVDRHNGQLEIESVEGEYTTVKVLLPEDSAQG